MKETQRKHTFLAVIIATVMLCNCLIIPNVHTVEAAGSKKLKVTCAKIVTVGKTIKMKTNVKATFKSSNKKIATVSSKGVIKGKKAGKVKITVTSKSNKKQKKVIKITVKKKQKSTVTTEKPTPNPKPTTEQPSVVKPTTEATTTEISTTEKATTEATTEKPTTEATTEEPKMVGITAKYRGQKVPKGSKIVEYGIDITEIYSDGSTQKGEYYKYHSPDVSDNFIEETSADGRTYHTYTVSYLGFTAPLRVEVVDVGDTLYPIQMIATYEGDTKQKGEYPDVDDISTIVTLSDRETYVEAEKTKLELVYFDLTERGDGAFYVVYHYTFEYNGEELYVCVRRIMTVPYE